MSWTISGVQITDDSVRKMLKHQRALRETASELQVAETAFAEAATIRLERKHKLDEIKAKLQKIASQGPDAVDEPQLQLFDDDFDEEAGGSHE
jgi:hypothetical protein